MVVMARALAPYGIQGWIKVRPYTESIEALLDYKAWWLAPARDETGWRRFTVLAARQQGDALVASLEGVDDRDAALGWRGAWVAVPRSELPAPAAGEFYWSDLVGLSVVNRAGLTLGRVGRVLETGAHPVLQVEAEDQGGSERLIPVVPAYIDAIDTASGRIVVDWPADF
jgi:16S rRNA processing protein RimM